MGKKHRRFLRCENWKENPLTSKLDTNFSASSPAILNSYDNFLTVCLNSMYHEVIALQTEKQKEGATP